MTKFINFALILTLLSTLWACSNKVKEASKEDGVRSLASMYTSYYNEAHYNYQPVIVTHKKGLVWEAVYLDSSLDLISIRTYKKPPYEQFLAQLKNDNAISFAEASKNIDSKLQNYFAADCPSIKKALKDYRNVDLDYKHGDSYNYNPAEATYTYLFVERNNGWQVVEISTHIAEHPVSQIYRIAKKGVEDCPHPTEPPEVGPTE